MIYRIAIWCNGKFLRYAHDHEMLYFRANPHGKGIDKMIIQESGDWGTLFEDWDDDPNDYSYPLEYRIEIGFKYGSGEYYHNDVLRIWENKCDDEPELNKYYFVTIDYNEGYDCLEIKDSNLEYEVTYANYALEWYANTDWCEGYEVVGNINEDPGLKTSPSIVPW